MLPSGLEREVKLKSYSERAMRHQCPGAVYHVMARGDGGKDIFESDEDRKAFLFRLGQVCGSHGWRVHAWVLMSNHFRLLLETVFQGRYKSVPVSAAVESPHYFRIVADYIHLNPAQAGLAGGKRDKTVPADCGGARRQRRGLFGA